MEQPTRFCVQVFKLLRKETVNIHQITVVDARMGRGKSSAAIRYMNENKGKKRFLYITPFLDEVGRICESCDFEQPDSDNLTKSARLKCLLRSGHNIAATHALFYLIDQESQELIMDKGYSLIIDESIQVVERLNVSHQDFNLIMTQLTDPGDNGRLIWRNKDYSGRFSDYKALADTGSLVTLDSALLNILNPTLLSAFNEVFMLTYMFDGQYQKAYLDYYGIPYTIVGVEEDKRGFFFSNKPDSPPPLDFTNLINLSCGKKKNDVGNGYYALSKGWYDKRSYSDPEIRVLRNGLRQFFQCETSSDNSNRLWTCYKNDINKLVDMKSGRFRSNFLQTGARATNQYRGKTNLAYMVNRFADPNIIKLFSSKGAGIDPDKFALSEMLQWIWRSAIRDYKPINIYIPSKRMRMLLLNWMNELKCKEV